LQEAASKHYVYCLSQDCCISDSHLMLLLSRLKRAAPLNRNNPHFPLDFIEISFGHVSHILSGQSLFWRCGCCASNRGFHSVSTFCYLLVHLLAVTLLEVTLESAHHLVPGLRIRLPIDVCLIKSRVS